jgi:hypothetical protein
MMYPMCSPSRIRCSLLPTHIERRVFERSDKKAVQDLRELMGDLLGGRTDKVFEILHTESGDGIIDVSIVWNDEYFSPRRGELPEPLLEPERQEENKKKRGRKQVNEAEQR